MEHHLIRAATAALLVAAATSAAWSAPQRSGRTAPAIRLPRLSSGFGVRIDPLHRLRAMHRGIDLPGTAGTPILASASGIVRFAGPAGSYGNMIEIEHDDGLRTRYAHLSRILVGAGAVVARGETIALMGSTGRSTGSHLHFEVRADGRAVDPLRFIDTGPLALPPSPGDVTEATTAPHRSAFALRRAAGIVRDLSDELPTGTAAGYEP